MEEKKNREHYKGEKSQPRPNHNLAIREVVK